MEFRIADTFTGSLSKLMVQEQKAVKTTAFDLQLNPTNPGLQFHRLDNVKDSNFWSVRVNADIRIIIHKTEARLLLCYVDHHDKAYEWARKRKLVTHPATGAAQLVEIREMVREVVVEHYVTQQAKDADPRPIFADYPTSELLGYGVPEEWLGDVQQADEDGILALAEHLPVEAAEALIELAVGGHPTPVAIGKFHPDPFDHPDAKRRFRLMMTNEELERALDYPWEKWMVFLHPEQQDIVEKSLQGPARVAGTAGTGKTIVALHRAVYLARQNRDARILLTTFSTPLANALHGKLRLLVSNEPRLGEQIEVYDLDSVCRRLYKIHYGPPRLAHREVVREALENAGKEEAENRFSRRFITSEWHEVVDAWQLDTWEDYRDVTRLGRKTRLPEKQRQILWAIFCRTRQVLSEKGLKTMAQLYGSVSEKLRATQHLPFDHIVVDEAQDISVAQLRFLAVLGNRRLDGLFFAGDLGQRIFQQPFSWKALGVDIRGRSKTLRVNYRTTHQIRTYADRLLAPALADVDGNVEEREGTVSLFSGPLPEIHSCQSNADEQEKIARWLARMHQEGIQPGEIGIFVRSEREIERATGAVELAALPYKALNESIDLDSSCLSISTMHLSKGLEFRAVAVIACDDEIIPSMQRLESVGDEADLEEIYNTERHLLYVACTRAREQLLLTGVNPTSEFIDDMLTS